MHGMQTAGAGQHAARGWLLLGMLLCADLASAQLSKAVAHDGHIKHNKFMQRRAEVDDTPAEDFDDVVGEGLCPLDVELRWMTEVSSSVYATPLITDLYSDGRKDVIVPAFLHYLEVLEGPDGAKSVGWPAFHKSTVMASPLLYDADLDGVRDVVLATYNGEVLFFKDSGGQLQQQLTVEPLKVRRHWYKGLSGDVVDHSHPDVGSGEGQPNPFAKDAHSNEHRSVFEQHMGAAKLSGSHAGSASPTPSPQQQQQQQQQAKQQPTQQQQQPTKQQGTQQPTQSPAAQAQQPALQVSPATVQQTKGTAQPSPIPPTQPLTVPAQQARQSAQQSQQQQQGRQQQQQQRQQPAANRRRLMAVADMDETGTPYALHRPSRRLQQLERQAGVTAAQGAEFDAAKQGLSEEALQSFGVFEDGTGEGSADAGADGSSGGAQQQEQEEQQEQGDPFSIDGAATHGRRFGLDGDEYFTDSEGLQHYDASQFDEFGEALPAGAGGDGIPLDQMGEPLESGAADAAAAGAGDAEAGAEEVLGGDAAHDPRRFQYHSVYSEEYDELFNDAGAGGAADQWQSEEFEQVQHKATSEFVWVDAHIMCTPAIADIDGDGHEEIVVAVSYFFDKNYYDDPHHAKQVEGIEIGKYVAGGIVVFDLRNHQLKWSQHLDLTTSDTTYKAYMYSSPTLVDIDGDGQLEIIVGTSLGFVYVLDCKGAPREGWPLQMGDVQGQVLVADLNNDGQVEIFAGDALGNIAMWDINGKELWERHTKSTISHGAIAADINSDGVLEVIFGTLSGHVYAVRGSDGKDTANFPFRTQGRIQAPAMATRLKDGPAMHIAIMSFDGYLYLIDGISGCADSVDIGEPSYSMVLADDLEGDGKLQLLVSTMNGNVYCFDTGARYHPLRAWTAQVQGINGLVARDGYFGVFALQGARQPRDIAGDKVQVRLAVHERRALMSGGKVVDYRTGPYNITAMLQGVGVAGMNAGPQPVIGVADTVHQPGEYVLEVPCPRTRTTATVHLDITDAHGLHYEDEFSLSFHMHFHKLLKWLVALPMLAMAVALLVVAGPAGEEQGRLRSYHLG